MFRVSGWFAPDLEVKQVLGEVLLTNASGVLSNLSGTYPKPLMSIALQQLWLCGHYGNFLGLLHVSPGDPDQLQNLLPPSRDFLVG